MKGLERTVAPVNDLAARGGSRLQKYCLVAAHPCKKGPRRLGFCRGRKAPRDGPLISEPAGGMRPRIDAGAAGKAPQAAPGGSAIHACGPIIKGRRTPRELTRGGGLLKSELHERFSDLGKGARVRS